MTLLGLGCLSPHTRFILFTYSSCKDADSVGIYNTFQSSHGTNQLLIRSITFTALRHAWLRHDVMQWWPELSAAAATLPMLGLLPNMRIPSMCSSHYDLNNNITIWRQKTLILFFIKYDIIEKRSNRKWLHTIPIGALHCAADGRPGTCHGELYCWTIDDKQIAFPVDNSSLENKHAKFIWQSIQRCCPWQIT